MARGADSRGITEQQMGDLRELVRAAQDYVERPFEPGETSRPLTVYLQHLDLAGWRLGWTLVAALREHHAALFVSFSETALHTAALDALLATETVPTVDELAAILTEKAGEEAASWIVEVPLANVSLSRSWATAGPTAALRRAWEGKVGESSAEGDSPGQTDATFRIFDHLQDHLGPVVRYMAPREPNPIDTRRGAGLLVIEEGSQELVISKAIAKAHFAVAVWPLLAPPDEGQLLPDVGVWWPQPYVRQTPEHKLYEPGEFMSKERHHGRDMWSYESYELPDDSVLAAPFEAFARLNQRSAQALLSSTGALDDAARGSRSRLASRIRDVASAIECLCEERPGAPHDIRRWENIAARFEVWARLAENRSYTDGQLERLQYRLRDARNIGTHGADAALIDLGWTGGDRTVRGGRNVPATDLAFTALQRDLGPMIYAVGEVLAAAWRHMRERDFDDDAFNELFETTE